MAIKLPYGFDTYRPRAESEYLDVKICEMPAGVEVDFMYNSLAVASDDRLYLGTCRTDGSAHILRYDPRRSQIEDVADMDEAIGDHRRGHDRHGKIHGRFFEGRDGWIYGGTHMDIALPFYGNFYDPHHYAGGHWFRLDPASGRIEDLGIPRPGEGLLTYTMDVENGILYGVTWPSGYLYSYEVASGQSRNLGRTAVHLGRFILCLSDGTVFYGLKDGFIGRYRRGETCIKSLPQRIPLCLSPIDWLWRKGALQCAIEWEKNRSFVAFAGNPYLMTVRENGALDVKEYPCFKNGIYSTFELAISYDRKVYYSNTHWGEPPLHAGRLYRLDPESGENELVGQFRCGKLTDFRHISGGAISRDGRTLYYFALVPKELRDRPDLTFERLNIENSQFARGKHTTYWPREYFKPVLVICRLAN
ncbi:MAG: hypothetical protein KJ964_08785 [Verrucomicrobia bacterium]|nr:hypothetical protein [Verrucomicrobiota bacterium]MBU1734702.1 hypothetical protein [Verrucomicrobiota bacterium]